MLVAGRGDGLRQPDLLVHLYQLRARAPRHAQSRIRELLLVHAVCEILHHREQRARAVVPHDTLHRGRDLLQRRALPQAEDALARGRDRLRAGHHLNHRDAVGQVPGSDGVGEQHDGKRHCARHVVHDGHHLH
jgi:hypothetical protein